MGNQNENKIYKLILTLTVIGIISGLALSLVYQWTNPHIEEHQRRRREEAIFNVLPEAEYYETREDGGLTFYEGFTEDGQRVGVALLTSGSGFQGEIEIMVGADPENEKIYSIRILEHEETPGLGARITEDEFLQHFEEIPFTTYSLVNQEPQQPEEIQGISGATISSENVVAIVEKAVEDIRRVYGGGSR